VKEQQQGQPRVDGVGMQSVKVVDGSSGGAVAMVGVPVVVSEVAVVQGASITRPVGGSSPELYATPATNGMTVVQIA